MTEDAFNPWTSDGAARVRRTAERLAAAVVGHAALLEGLADSHDVAALFAANEALAAAAQEFANASFEYTGVGSPLGTVADYLGDWVDEGDESGPTADPVTALTVLRRSDFQVEDEAAVLRAGREAFLTSTQDGEAAAASDVTHVGRALYWVAHDRGWDALKAIPGLRPTGGVAIVVSQDDPLRGEPDSWPDDLFAVEGDLLYVTEDVWL